MKVVMSQLCKELIVFGGQVGDQLLLEGQLRICWGIVHPILFKEKDDEQPSTTQHRHSYSPTVTDGTDFVVVRSFCVLFSRSVGFNQGVEL